MIFHILSLIFFNIFDDFFVLYFSDAAQQSVNAEEGKDAVTMDPAQDPRRLRPGMFWVGKHKYKYGLIVWLIFVVCSIF